MELTANFSHGQSSQRPNSELPSVVIHTHGCKLNQSDSQALARQFKESGYLVVDAPAQADVVVLNSCTVTSTADAKARQFLRSARRANPDAVVVVTGCYAQRSPESFQALEEVSLVLGNTQKPALVDSITEFLKSRNFVEYVGKSPSPDPGRMGVVNGRTGERSRAMVKIQEGCDQVCAYCIVPKVRGRERSISPQSVVADIRRQSSEGRKEAVLTGTQLGTYGFDIPGASLVGLVQQILEETSIERLRVSSLQAQEITTELLALWQNPRLCPHFHIPLQSGSNRVLQIMRRRYDTRRFADTVALVRGALPHAGITTDIIVGFPGEGDQDFESGLRFVESMTFSDMHVFPFSPRPSTSAAYFKGHVNESVKKGRMATMLELAIKGRRRFREEQLGTVRTILWEPQRDDTTGAVWNGLSDNYIRVRTDSQRDLANTITNARLSQLDGDLVSATIE